MKKTWQLDYKDKAIHRHMSFAANQLRKVARLLREYKANSPEWQKHADVIESSADLMDIWRKVIRSEKQTSLEVEAEEVKEEIPPAPEEYEAEILWGKGILETSQHAYALSS